MNQMSQINIQQDTIQSYKEKAQLYIEVFGEYPRNEGWVDEDGKLYPLSQKPQEIKTTPFYNQNDIEQMREERSMMGEKYLGFLAKNNDQLIGFINGWFTSLGELNEQKLKLQKNDLMILKNIFIQKYGIEDFENIFYLAEYGALSEMRGKGVGRELFNTLDEAISKSESPLSILRTTATTYVPSVKPFGSGGYQEVYKYNDLQNRIIMSKKI